MNSLNQTFAQAQQWHQRGQLPQAEIAYRRLLDQDPEHADGRHFLGLLLAQQARYAEAVAELEAACRLQPANPTYLSNLGEARFRQGQVQGAQQAWRAALRLKPQFPEAHYNLANSLKQQGQLEEAIAHYSEVTRLVPTHAKAWFNLGNTYREAGKYRSAIGAYEAALRIDPAHADAHNNLGATLKEFDRLPEAMLHYQFARWLKPDSSEALLNLAQLQETLGQTEEARASLAALIEKEPDQPLLKLMRASICPTVPFSNYEIDSWRASLSAEIAAVAASGAPLDLLGPDRLSGQMSAEMPYQGRDEKPLRQAYAQLFAPFLPRFEAPPPHPGRPKIGFVVTGGHEGVFIKCMRGIVQRLSSEKFELVIVCSLPNGEKILAPAIARGEIAYLGLSHKLAEAIETVRQARFDLLYYWECGTDAINYFLPFCRLARVQCTSWGWPVTSAIPNMDFFLSMEGIEPEGADAHYTEKLIKLPHLATYYFRPPIPAVLKPRSAFGLPAHAHWYLCHQNVRKLHPDYDQLVAEVLRRDPRGIFIVTGHKQATINHQLLRRIQGFHPDIADRVHVLINLPEPDYLSLVSHAEVILDTLYYCGGANTTYDAFACGTPVVTLPTAFHRGRYTAAAYAQIGLSECIAKDRDDYVRRAVALGMDPALRRELSAELLSRSVELFEDPRAVAELEACLLNLCA